MHPHATRWLSMATLAGTLTGLACQFQGSGTSSTGTPAGPPVRAAHVWRTPMTDGTNESDPIQDESDTLYYTYRLSCNVLASPQPPEVPVTLTGINYNGATVQLADEFYAFNVNPPYIYDVYNDENWRAVAFQRKFIVNVKPLQQGYGYGGNAVYAYDIWENYQGTVQPVLGATHGVNSSVSEQFDTSSNIAVVGDSDGNSYLLAHEMGHQFGLADDGTLTNNIMNSGSVGPYVNAAQCSTILSHGDQVQIFDPKT